VKTPGCKLNPKYVAGMAPWVAGVDARGRSDVAGRGRAALGPEEQPAGWGGGCGDLMIWEDELDPPPQAVPNQQESNSIGKEIAGKRRPDFPLEMLRFDMASVAPNRMNVTLSYKQTGKVNLVCFDAPLRQAAWHV
jgi:hypothetical protein